MTPEIHLQASEGEAVQLAETVLAVLVSRSIIAKL